MDKWRVEMDKPETMNPPAVPCDECMNDPKRTAWEFGEFMVTHCRHTNSGGVFVAQKNHWIIISPVDEEVFAHVAAQQIAGMMGAVETAKPN